MPKLIQHVSQDSTESAGLRGRKKARRRQEILNCAEALFSRNGYDATTMAEIAQETGVSPPTIFNYFGSKENVLSALIFEGTARQRATHQNNPRLTDCSFATALGTLLCAVSENTMRIAGKRVWRYAEAANIRRPNSEFEIQFAESDAMLLSVICAFLNDYDLVLRSGDKPNCDFLASLIFNSWTAQYFAYIKDDSMQLETHKARVRSDMNSLVSMIFDETFAATSPLKNPEASQ